MHLQGATLLETLLALAILAILFSCASPWLNDFYQTTSEEILQYDLLQFIKLAQQAAEANHVPIAICKSKNQVTCKGEWLDGLILFVNENRDGVVAHQEKILYVKQFRGLKGTLNFRSFPFYRDYLLFLPNGLKQTDNSLFWYCRYSKSEPSFAIALAKSGRVRILKPEKTGGIYDVHGKKLQC